MTSKRFESIPLNFLILSKMYRHEFSYIRVSLVTVRGLIETTPPL